MSDPTTLPDWDQLQPVDTEPLHVDPVVIEPEGEPFLIDQEGTMRRDPSDVIRVGDTYYLWYTKVSPDTPHYPEGWAGSVWYATSPDGFTWTERGACVQPAPSGAWDSYGCYTPNILSWQGRWYLAYTGMSDSQSDWHFRGASIGLSVADSPDGPWQRIAENPVIAPGTPGSADSFLCDDTVFVIRDGLIWLYYKGFPAVRHAEGGWVRSRGNTFLMTASAETPGGPYRKHPPGALHRGHEAVVWPEADGWTGSLCLTWGKLLYYRAPDGVSFQAWHPLASEAKAAGLYRRDFEPDWDGSRPSWGVRMAPRAEADISDGRGGWFGLQRFAIRWPQ